MKEYTDNDLEHIRDIIRDNDAEDARAELATLHPADIAELNQNLDLDKAVSFWKQAEEAGGGSALLPKKIQMRKWIEE